MTFKINKTKEDQFISTMALHDNAHTPHWRRFGGGAALIEFTGHKNAGWVSIDTIETGHNPHSSKRTMITLDTNEVRIVRDFFNKILGEASE